MKLEATRDNDQIISITGFPIEPATKVLGPESKQRAALFEGLGIKDPGENECYVSFEKNTRSELESKSQLRL